MSACSKMHVDHVLLTNVLFISRKKIPTSLRVTVYFVNGSAWGMPQIQSSSGDGVVKYNLHNELVILVM
jgi:hypothetical protein